MLRLFQSWGLITDEAGRLHATAASVRYLSGKSPESVASYIATMKYKPFRELYELLRDGGADTWHVERGVTKSWDALMQTDEFTDLNTRGMEERGRIFAPHLATLLDCTNESSILGVGGGSGVYSAYLLMRYPALTATILERPPIDQPCAERPHGAEALPRSRPSHSCRHVR
ncbi:methyltransferase [Bradyrhizobium sp. 164]|uniref:methyltransferase n=1 Tax=Bradyrhizobium sp. 164 TaxID=2782637 RepID=UPI003209B19F